MKRFLVGVAFVAGLMVAGVQANAGDRGYQGEGAHRSSQYYRGGPKVKGYVARRGGYSYTYQDSINTYGDSRTQYGSTNVFRDFGSDKQTPSGPFDHGFFFDSGIQQNGGSSPYLN